LKSFAEYDQFNPERGDVMNTAVRVAMLAVILSMGSLFIPRASAALQLSAADIDRQNQAAQDWLNLADHGKSVESWDAASADFKSGTTIDQWRGTLNNLRTSLGRRLTRGLDSRQEVQSIEGHYMALMFSSSFANKQQVKEKLILVYNTDGHWRVAAYTVN
jgi:hypothetical protein